MQPRYLVLGGVGLVAVVVVAILLLSHKGGGPGPDGGSGGILPTAGAFSFHIDPPQALYTAADTNADKANKAAKPAAVAAEKLIHDFYVKAYLSPAEWTNGAYADVFDSFSPAAKAEAMKQLDVMTAGRAAADIFASIQASNAHLREKVLMDPNGQPYSVVAVVTFDAAASLKDGTAGTLSSEGQYILQKAASGWQVTSFSVTRSDRPAKASPAGSGATPTVASP